jgi:uncharacterized protein YbjT (DUF2867 family)
MNVLLFGATGMVGQGVLRECLLDAGVTRILSVVRRPTAERDPRLAELVVRDIGDLDAYERELAGTDACFFCAGVSSAGMSEAEYTRVTHDLTLAAAQTVARVAPGATFIYVSGQGTDSTESSRSMWARVKGRTENALLTLPFRAAYMFRPGFIQPLHGIRSRTPLYRALYVVMAPVAGLLRRWAPGMATSTEQVGRAMLRVAREGYPKRVLETRDMNLL